ncbi:MAG: hypothetical protein K6A36_03310 [Paludibacteraceae bacterium]|nr:hypothetical protein [Paludibacteraceae bacterium]
MNTKHLLILITATLFAACRPQSDDLLSYGQNDGRTFNIAASSYEEQFKALWTALNCNYGIWDYEEELGMDWDDVYETYLPKFQELDKKEEVTEEEFTSLYADIINPLHDGHLFIQVKNLKTGRFHNYMPSQNRNYSSRRDFEKYNLHDLTAYMTQNGDYKLIESRTVNTSPESVIRQNLNVFASIVNAKIEEYDHKYSLSEAEQFVWDYCQEFLYDYTDAMGVSEYNSLCDKYAQLGQLLGMELPKIDSKLADYSLSIEYAYFASDIVYIRINGFKLSAFLDDRYFANFLNADNATSRATQKAVKSVWNQWFNKIEELHNHQALRGVIIDVRDNGGGFVNDYQYVLGALLPSGGYTSHQLRTKSGTGRYDYSPLMNFTFPTYEEQHVVIDAPIVVLTNCNSVSMAESTALGAQTLPNGHVIGTQTWGGLSALNTEPTYYSETYASAFGKAYETAFYAYIPKYIAILPHLKSVNHGIIEGVGIIPDIEVEFDRDLYVTTGRDTQLERAIEFICSEVQ